MAKGIEPRIGVTAEGILKIEIPLKSALKERVESESGKSLLLCSTRQFMDTKEAGNISVNLNVMQRNPAYAEFEASKNNGNGKGRDPDYDKWVAAHKSAGVA